MVKKLLSFVLLSLFVLFSANSVFATVEKGDTLVISSNDAVEVPWNEIIASDTLADGSREHSVYELEPDGWYPLSATLTAATFDLNIIGGKRSQGQARPVILVADPFSGWWMMSAAKNLTLKGVHVMQCAEVYGGNIGAWARGGISVSDTNNTLVFEDMIWDFNIGTLLGAGNNGVDLHATNCLFRFSLPTNNSVWAGQGFDLRQANLDTVVLQNCTWYGGGPFFLITVESAEKQLIIDHCTIADFVQFPIHGTHWRNTTFSNNLFYNAHTLGEDTVQVQGQDPDELPYGIVDIDTIFASMDDEANRVFNVLNNNNYVSPNIIDYWNTCMADPATYHMFAVADPTFYDGFMNSRTRAMFEADETWPGLVLENTTSLDPEFENFFDYSDTLINFSKYYHSYAWPEALPTTFMKDPDGEPLIPTDPMVYSLKITNEALRSADRLGGVIGDQTWELPNGYNSTQEELAALHTQTAVKESSAQPVDFTLSQNYPNPFNPSTNIAFDLKKTAMVELNIYNVLGQRVKTLVNRTLTAGMHSVQWDGLDENKQDVASGIYIYELKSGDTRLCKKMMLLQ